MRKTDYDEETYYQMVERDLKPLILITHKAEELIADHSSFASLRDHFPVPFP